VSLESKLALKDQRLELLHAPSDFRLDRSGTGRGDPALLVFVADKASLENQIRRIVESAAADHLTWVAYPKGGQLDTDLNRDSLAALLMRAGIRPVTQISVDATWSALRFRPSNNAD
jgi:hypothetical protein